MARFLIGTLPLTGHFNPALPIARKLVERGHTVWWYTGRKYQAKVEATGAIFVPMQAGLDIGDADLNDVFPARKGLKNIALLKHDLKYFFANAVPGHIQDLKVLVAQFKPDVILGDTGFTAPAVLHEMGGPVWAAFSITSLTFASRDTAPFGLALMPDSSVFGRLRNRALYALVNKVIFRDVNAHYRRLRAEMGLPPTNKPMLDTPLSPYLYLQATHPDFEYPRSDMPPQVHFTGPLLPDVPADFVPPAWWDEMVNTSRPVVHVTQGTLSNDPEELIIPTLRALANEDVLVVATTGGKPVESINLNPLPANVRLERFIPHAELLPYVDVMITNGGYNGVQVALAHGVPLVAAGASEDKPEIANRVQWSGVGVNLKTNRPTTTQISEAVRTILQNERYKQRAHEMKVNFAKLNGALRATVLLEQLAVTQRPVLNKQAAHANGRARLTTSELIAHI